MTKPPTMVIPNGCRNSEPSPPDNTNGSAPNSAASVVIIIGRKRNKQARKWLVPASGRRFVALQAQNRPS